MRYGRGVFVAEELEDVSVAVGIVIVEELVVDVVERSRGVPRKCLIVDGLGSAHGLRNGRDIVDVAVGRC